MRFHVAAPAKAAVRFDTYLLTHVLGITLLLALLAEAVNRSGADLAVSRYFFDMAADAFPWRTSRALEILGHRVVLVLPIGVAVAAIAAAIASHWLPALRPWRRPLWGVAATCVLGQVIISQLKHYTALPRPWALHMFGGYANYPDHFWASSRREGGGALPSNHAGAGYAMLSLYFAGWAMRRPEWRWGGLAVGVGAGLVFSLVRIMQGAHFLSQTIWAACVMWGVASIVFCPLLVRPPSALAVAQQDAW